MKHYGAIRALLVGALVGFVCILALALIGQAQSAGFERTCFPKGEWNTGTVAAQYRPCARITKVYEDGSFKFAVSDANGTVRYSGGVGAADR